MSYLIMTQRGWKMRFDPSAWKMDKNWAESVGLTMPSIVEQYAKACRDHNHSIMSQRNVIVKNE